MIESLNYYLRLATEKQTIIRAIFISLSLALIFNLLYMSGWESSIKYDNILAGQLILSFIIPLLLFLIFSVASKPKLKPGNISHVDALLECSSCKKTDFHVHIGQELEDCPMCKEKTKWKPTKIFSLAKSNSEVVKSLALFARHNPQPLFRVDEMGTILGSNPASENLLNLPALSGHSLLELIPELKRFNLKTIIQQEAVEEVLIFLKGNYYNLLLKGVQSINTINIYGNDITKIKLAEQKIQTQAQEIKESIHYAWTIQKAMLANREFVAKVLPAHFIMYRPRNVVSGDFYWINQINNFKIIIAADSTGHGVPGAFMSMLGISILNDIILKEKLIKPDLILNELRKRIINSLKTGASERDVQDGMDIAMAVVNKEDYTMAFAGAFNSMILLRNNNIQIIKADDMPVGVHVHDGVLFSSKNIQLKIKDRFYLFTDGYKDQFGGERDKKFGMKKFKQLILETGKLPINEQHKTIERTFDSWKEGYEQVDDVLLIGVEI